MSMLYEPPTNVSTAVDMIEWFNLSTSMWLFQGILMSIFIISMVGMLKNPSNTASKCFSAAGFITMILAVFARVLNLIPTSFMSIWIIVVGLGAAWMYAEEVY